MNIQVISDIHAEFHQDRGYSFINGLTPSTTYGKPTEVLVIAGDFALIHQYKELIPLLVDKYPHIVLVAGNHEYYDSNRPTVLAELERLSLKYDNFHVLEDSTVTIEGQRFIGSTLWFPDIETARPYWRNLNDFNVIRGFEDWVFDVNAKSMEYLKRNIKPTDIVVTHHIPTQMGSNKRWWNTPLQPFFVCNMEPTLLMQHPKVWIFGHTHDSHDSMFGTGKKKTHLVCNPFGYARQAENEDFQEDLVVSSLPGLGV